MNTILLIAMVLSAEPTRPAPKMCTVGCLRDGRNGPGVTTCFYDLKQVCGKREVECKETETMACEPRSVEIGRDEYWGATSYIYY
jgi:hypothetical protein